ncbi:hypothetical protein ACFV4M_26165, partial [Kitasatospora indigofera]
ALAHLAHTPTAPPADAPAGPPREPVNTPLPTAPGQVPTALPPVGNGPLPQPLPVVWKVPKHLLPPPVPTATAHQVPTGTGGVPTLTAPAPAQKLPAAPVAIPDNPVLTPAPNVGEEVPTAAPTAPEEVPTADAEEDDREEPALVRLGEAEAAAVIEECWREGISQREAARRATRAPSFVGRIYKRLDADRGAGPQAGPLAA